MYPPIPLSWYLIVSAILFGLGIVGVLLRKNSIIVLMSIELMLNAVNLAFIVFARHVGNADGQVIVFVVMAVAAAEAAVGLALFVTLYRHKETLYVDDFRELKH